MDVPLGNIDPLTSSTRIRRATTSAPASVTAGFAHEPHEDNVNEEPHEGSASS